MESINFYKLISPYEEDITKNCKLNITEIDDNFLAFKDNDISGGTFNKETISIDIARNNGEIFSIDLSGLKEFLPGYITEPSQVTNNYSFLYNYNVNHDYQECSGCTSGQCSGCSVSISGVSQSSGCCLSGFSSVSAATANQPCDWETIPNVFFPNSCGENCSCGTPSKIPLLDITGVLDDNGVLNLTWNYENASGETVSTSISGFATSYESITDASLSGTGNKKSPTRISNTYQTGFYKAVKGIVDTLPTEDVQSGDRYVTREIKHGFGHLYNYKGLKLLQGKLKAEKSLWRIPSKEDWDKLFNAIESCNANKNHDGIDVDSIYGEEAGYLLKSQYFWGNLKGNDKYGFNAFPACFCDMYGDVYIEPQTASFWSNTKCNNGYFIKEINNDYNGVVQRESIDEGMYSVRLVYDYDDPTLGFGIDAFGLDYKPVLIKESQQIWTSMNVSLDLGEEYSRKLRYNATDDAGERCYVMNHWNGLYWERKQLQLGDSFNVVEEGNVATYYVTLNKEGDATIARGFNISVNEDGKSVLRFDCGWY